MTLTATSLLDQKVTTDRSSYRVKELFYTPEGRAMRYALVDTGGWFRGEEVLASASRLSFEEDGGWHLHMSDDEMESAPVIDTLSTGLIDLPPLVVGPFGYTFSPLAMATTMENATEAPDLAAPDDTHRDGSGRVMNMDRITGLIGRDAYADHGPLGKVVDVEMTEEFVLSRVVLDSGQRKDLRLLRPSGDRDYLLFA